MIGWADKKTDGWMDDGCVSGWMVKQMGGRMNGWMDGQADTDALMDGWMDV